MMNSNRLSRRELLKVGVAGAIGFTGCRQLERANKRADTAQRSAARYDGLESEEYLGEVETLAKIEDKRVATEGPAAARDGKVYFTNIPASKILVWDPRSRLVSVFRDNTGRTNGLLFDRQGRLVACEADAGRITRTDMTTGKVEVLADSFKGFPFAPPNDICADASGRLYFSSRPGGKDPDKGNVNAVYRLDPDGTVTQLLKWPDIHNPNGIVTSPENKILYLVEAHGGAHHHRDIRAYDLQSDGTLTNERVLIEFYPGRSGDGMCVDSEGNLYVAAGLHKTRKTSETLDTRPGIHVLSPTGQLLAYRSTPEDTLTNCTFGGEDLRTLYITCGTLLLSIRTAVAGKASYRPEA